VRYLLAGGGGNAWEQYKPEARKTLENAARTRQSGARCVERYEYVLWKGQDHEGTADCDSAFLTGSDDSDR